MAARLRDALRSAGFDVLTAAEAGNLELSDSAQLVWAAGQGRVIVTANLGHFAALHTEWASTGRVHSGIVLLTSQRAKPEVIATKLVTLARLRSPETMRSAVVHLNASPDQLLV